MHLGPTFHHHIPHGGRLHALAHHAKNLLRRRSFHNQTSSSSPVASAAEAPRGHFAVYVGEGQENRFVVPLSYLKAEEEYGFDNPTGRLTIPCTEDAFLSVANNINHQC
ncbi:hypothetical protein NMG60_11014721 [Bertholletia excelsa]